jgi:hypothetical protein
MQPEMLPGPLQMQPGMPPGMLQMRPGTLPRMTQMQPEMLPGLLQMRPGMLPKLRRMQPERLWRTPQTPQTRRISTRLRYRTKPASSAMNTAGIPVENVPQA